MTMSDSLPIIWAQALASQGTVQILLTSSEFEGEIPMTVTLEPAVIKWVRAAPDPSRREA
ncbi:MAG: hypothetical protein IPP47_33080 [Bryobacterales bacterium]|nr:hypothetical protein [Bryobacterales bacterium]